MPRIRARISPSDRTRNRMANEDPKDPEIVSPDDPELADADALEPVEPDDEPETAGAEGAARHRETPRTVPAPRAAAGSVVPSDALQRYLSDIRRIPILTREEEHEIAVRWHEQGDRQA